MVNPTSISVRDSSNAVQNVSTLDVSLVTTAAGGANRVVLVDPTSGNGALITLFHNADNQALGTVYGLMTGGVDQLLNANGNLDRKRGAYADNLANTGIAAESAMLWNGASFDRQRTPLVFKTFNAVAIATETTLWTPTAGKKFRLMGGFLSAGTAAGNIILKDNTLGTTIFIIPKTTVDVQFIIPPLGNGILSAAINNVLTATGVATQTLSGTIFGTEE